jgi:4-hydroxy-tetrahydrodipicolinate reductase
VVLDFSSADGAAERIRTVAESGSPLVEGTTALDAAAAAALRAAAVRVAVVEAPNPSPGIALLAEALTRILGRPGAAWDVALTDRHHRHKKDAPSGTALFLARLIAGATGREPTIASYRQGGVVGEHTVHLSGLEEELVLTHRALERSVFARGALLAAAFAQTAAPGHYGMGDVLG